jgi:cold-inducible RNA-binding protein
MSIGTRLYVGNLSFNTSDATLRAAFEQDGRQVVEVKIVTDRETGQPRGFAFVEMASPADADAAVAALDGKSLDGRTLKVNPAQERSGGGGRGGGGGGWNRGGGGGGGGRGGGGRGGRDRY